MFAALMKVQWKWSRVAVLILTLVGFAAPLMTARTMFRFGIYDSIRPADIVIAMQSGGVLYAFLAAAAGLALAFTAWSADQRGRHVYVLSLPVNRARLALMRFGAGTLFLLGPTLGLLAGCLVTIAVVSVPPGMHAYPFAVTLRFFLAALLAFAMFFAVAAASQRAAATLLCGILGFLLVASLLPAVGVRADVLGKTFDWMFTEPGLLSIFTGRWMLFDV